MQSVLRIDDEHQQVRLFNCLEDLSLDLDIHRHPRIVSQSAGINQPELTPVPIRASEVTITRGASFVAHDCAVLTNNAVEERGLADVGSTDERYHGEVHASTPLSSDESTSMKSYDGKIGIGSALRTFSRV